MRRDLIILNLSQFSIYMMQDKLKFRKMLYRPHIQTQGYNITFRAMKMQSHTPFTSNETCLELFTAQYNIFNSVTRTKEKNAWHLFFFYMCTFSDSRVIVWSWTLRFFLWYWLLLVVQFSRVVFITNWRYFNALGFSYSALVYIWLLTASQASFIVHLSNSTWISVLMQLYRLNFHSQ